MPLVGLICRGCGGIPVPFDHFETTSCGITTCDPRLARAAVLHEQSRYSYDRPTVTVTQLLGCTRQGAIQAAESWHMDPLAQNAALTGVAWGNFMDAGAGPQYLIQEVLEGVIEGVNVSGKPDALKPEIGCIVDDKHQNDFGRAEIEKNGPKPEHVAQVSLYGELVRQKLGWEPLYGLLCYHWTAGVPKNVPVNLMPLTDVLDFKPHNGPATVRENLAHSQKPWREQPLTGERIIWKSGKTMCDNCQAKSICWAQAKGATF